jgi:hypothetical protein
MAELKESITELLRQYPTGLSIGEIAEKINTSRHTISINLAELKGENKITIRKVAAAKLHYLKEP